MKRHDQAMGYRTRPELRGRDAPLIAEPAPPRRKRRAQHRFTMVPGTWEEVLGKARVSGSTYAVALALLYESWRLKSNDQEPIVKLTGAMLKPVGVGRDRKGAALLALIELGSNCRAAIRS